MSTEKKMQELIRGLRAMANFYESHPAVPCPLDVTINVFVSGKEELAKAAKAMGTADKVVFDEWFWLEKKFSDNVQIQVNAKRHEVCKKVLVGVEHVEEQVIPAQAEQVVPAHDVEKYEWQCDESLLGNGAAS